MRLGDLECFKKVAEQMGYTCNTNNTNIKPSNQTTLKDKIGTDQSILNRYRKVVRSESKICIDSLTDTI